MIFSHAACVCFLKGGLTFSRSVFIIRKNVKYFHRAGYFHVLAYKVLINDGHHQGYSCFVRAAKV